MPRIYSDGSCLKNPGGASGWSFCVTDDSGEFPELIDSGGEISSTNNRMEMMAVIKALEAVTSEVPYRIYTDSQLVLRCATGQWQRKANLDLWVAYDAAAVGKTLDWKWVKAHSGDPYNEMVDTLARAEAYRIRAKAGFGK
jgi:ribonuclease HI